MYWILGNDRRRERNDEPIAIVTYAYSTVEFGHCYYSSGPVRRDETHCTSEERYGDQFSSYYAPT